ncbi:hypothetical protein Poli38472_007898 [Pythium oligandrum]|uniref:Polycystin cation channel PKD1/PKD2 domain-containing protein n=1 Tax=Pythium oligandrum TaxID=41045 RepID=A0A8K1CR00_PYTOL|nr:hypothetical protein Poli38472_007898 [Pythium oligandrum]|eukprot:TMW68226.1 hypothetical protein Poli38472_007898 [Pythium oligandrum]
MEDDDLRERLLAPCDDSDAADVSTALSDGTFPCQRSLKSRMTVVERMMLSPYEKWIKHRRFPYKIVLHVLLLGLTFSQMVLYESQNAEYMRASHRNWAYFFLPPSNDVGESPRFQRDLYTINDTVRAVFYLRDAYFSIVNESVANYEYHVDPSTHIIRPINLSVTRMDGQITHVRHYQVFQNSTHIGPFHAKMSSRKRRHLLQSLQSVRFTFHLRDRQYGSYYQECFDWSIHVRLQVVERTQIRAIVDDCEIASCASRLSFWQALKQRFVWLHIVVAVVAGLYLVLSVRALLRSIRLIKRAEGVVLEGQRVSRPGQPASSTQSTTQSTTASTSSIPLSLRLKLFNGLQVVVFMALLMLLVSSIWSLFFLKAHVPISFWHRLLQATALLLLWSSLVGYLEHNRQIYSIVLTLRWGAPRVLQYLLGVSPIFLGYALFGTIYFGPRIKMFGSLSASMMTLFAVMNGDVILDTFDALERHGFMVSGKFYLYSFVSLFIYVVLNVFIAIVEEAFFATRQCRRMLDVLFSDPKYSSTNVTAQDAEVSTEMVKMLLRLIEEGDDAHSASSRPRTDSGLNDHEASSSDVLI